MAEECGAHLARIDTADAEAGLAAAGPVDLVVAAVQDPADELLRATLRAGSAHVGIVRKVDNLGPTAIVTADLARRPTLVMGHWQAGAATFAALTTATAFQRVERVEFAALFDPADTAGQRSADDSTGFRHLTPTFWSTADPRLLFLNRPAHTVAGYRLSLLTEVPPAPAHLAHGPATRSERQLARTGPP
ncbi:hypothetical protein [Streptomyces nodosus]|uniref:Uncharacterized protein n=1 Tax=Streptomyces nodosus TaxID=40318 RepID=A0A5P2VX99_9ACTN|nr:hypothetical protein [Streptomyces nodosus]MBB4789615.1 hypothetical protein [Streptomyces nodosus]QEV37422.1 hypothetical protein CP978_01545 [Streptomyces nodosus]